MALQLFKYPFTAMGSPCEIQLYAASVTEAAAVAQSIIHDIERLESKYSRYRPNSFLAEINRAAAKARKIAIDDETASLLHYAQTCYEQSDGLFDISSGVLRKLWDFKQSDAMRIPNPEHIQRVLQYVGWDKVRWTSSSLAFSAKNMELDFGGIVKEYAADRRRYSGDWFASGWFALADWCSGSQAQKCCVKSCGTGARCYGQFRGL